MSANSIENFFVQIISIVNQKKHPFCMISERIIHLIIRISILEYIQYLTNAIKMNVISIDSIFVHALKHNKNYKEYNSIFYNIKHSLDTYIELIQAKIRVKKIEDSIENFFVRDIFNRKF